MKSAVHSHPIIALGCAFLALAPARAVEPLEAPSAPSSPAAQSSPAAPPAKAAAPAKAPASAGAANAKADGLFAGQGVADAIGKITEKLKGPAQALDVQLDSTAITLQVQDPAAPTRVLEYTYEQRAGLLARLSGGGAKITGPEPVQLNLVNQRLEENLFPLAEVDFTAVPAAVAEALKRARVEGGAVESITIRRQFLINESGPVQWEISIASENETAIAYADAKGKIRSLDLSGTKRAQTLDLTQGGEPLAEAVAQIRGQVGDQAVLRAVSISKKSISFETRDPRSPADFIAYAYDIHGIRKSSNPLGGDVQRLLRKTAVETELFAVGEVDWAQMPALSKVAVVKLAIPGGQLRDIQLARPPAPAGAKPVHWKFTVAAGPFAESGTMEFNAKTGVPGRITLPRSLQKAVNLVEMDAVKRLIAAVRAEFGADAGFTEISIHPERAFVNAHSLKQPAEVRQFLYDEREGFQAWGAKEERAPQAPAETWRVSLPEIEAALPKLPALVEKAPERAGLPKGAIERVTFFRQSPFYPGNRATLVELRVKSPEGQGRVIYNAEGKEVDAVPYSARGNEPADPAKLRRMDMTDATAARVAKFDAHFTSFVELSGKYGETRWNKTRATDPAGILKLPKEDFRAWAKLQNEMRDSAGQILEVFAERKPPSDAIASSKAKPGARRRVFWEAQHSIWDLSSQQAKLLDENWDEWVARGFPEDQSQLTPWQKEVMRLQGEIDAANRRSTDGASAQ